WNIINSVHYKKTGKVIILNKEGFYIGGVNEDQLLTVFSPFEILNKIISVKDCQSMEFQSQNGETYVAGISFAGVNNNFIVFPKWIVLQLQKVSESYFIISLVKKYLFLIVLLMLFVIFIFSVYTSNLIIKPFNILIKGTEAASKGDLHFKTEIRSFEEISILSKNFDNMIEKLNAMHVKILDEMSEKENAQKQLLELNENLEKKVEERAFEIISLKEFYQNILNSINSGILFINRESKLEFINPTGEKLLNISFNRNKGKPVNEVSFPESFKNLLIEYLGNNTDFDSKEISFPINNTNIILGIKATFLSKESPILGSIIIFNDITERKKLQNEIIQTEKMFSCGLLSTGMAHDFNNVLNRIKISADISRKLSTNPELEEIFNEIKDGISEGQAMTRSLLSFAKNEEIELVPVDILSLLKSFEIKSKTLLNKNSVKLTINCNKRLVILAEPNHMMQIFLNLVQNAIQAIRDNGVITITANNVGNNCIINFSDNGPGISKVVLPHIFEPFYSTKVVSESSGWGLGLALVKSLAEKLKGNIEVTSTENHGTVFTLEFPIFNKITKEDL
ncbi:MAG: PAS/PAC sensor hybrid histidine kinase, partial [uncultured bacterium]